MKTNGERIKVLEVEEHWTDTGEYLGDAGFYAEYTGPLPRAMAVGVHVLRPCGEGDTESDAIDRCMDAMIQSGIPCFA